MKVIFSHGKESGPWGSKIRQLSQVAKDKGFSVDSIDYQKITDPDLRVEHLISVGKEEDRLILVGSSMGGYVSLAASEALQAEGVFLLAPALYMPGYQLKEYPILSKKVEIVHGWNDAVIPFENSVRYGAQSHCKVHLIEGDHRLNSSLETVSLLFSVFLDEFSKQE